MAPLRRPATRSQRATCCSQVLLLLMGCGATPSSAAPPPPVALTPPTSTTETAAPVALPPTPPSPTTAPAPSPPATPDPAPPLLTLDTHMDTTQRMLDAHDDLAQRLADGHVDFPRMREGGLSGGFFSVWVNPRKFRGEAAWQRALALTHAVRALAAQHPDEAALCTTTDDVRRAAASGRIALLIGVEGAHALGTDDPELALARLRELYALGARYLTLTWTNDNALAHASTGAHPELGLTDLGRRAVREMNQLGMIADVSHVSDQTVSDVLDVTTRPVLASHSAARALSDNRRNLPDALLARIAAGGGAVCVNFYPQFLDAAYGAQQRAVVRAHRAEFDALEATGNSSTARGGPSRLALALRLDPTLHRPTVALLVNHVAHVVRVAGPGAACLGSDFDGIGELPAGLDDASDLGVLRDALSARGLDVRTIAAENVLRVLDAQPPSGVRVPP